MKLLQRCPVRHHGGERAQVLAIACPQLLDACRICLLGQSLMCEVRRSADRLVILDWRQVKFADAAIVEPLLELRRLLHQRGGRLLLSGVSERLAMIFRLALAGMERREPGLLEIVAD